MSLKKLCSGCNKALIEYGQIRCPACEKNYRHDKAESNRAYDTQVRQGKDSQYTSFYHSTEWQKTVKQCKARYSGLDIYNYYVLGSLEYGSICHHIEPIKTDEGWESRFNVLGLIFLTADNHALIHSLYDKDFEGTKRLLIELVNKWNSEMR